MGTTRPVERVKLFVGMLASDASMFDTARPLLEEKFGKIDSESGLIDFSAFTDFYDREMGAGIKRKFLSFERLVDPTFLAEAKLITNEMEKALSGADGNRRINIDPGYIALSKLVLASVKDRPHRLCIGKGIFAEITLHYRGGSFRPWEWSYADYSSPEYVSYLNGVRAAYHEQLSRGGAG